MAINEIPIEVGTSLAQSLEGYATEAQCEAALIQARWPHGFVAHTAGTLTALCSSVRGCCTDGVQAAATSSVNLKTAFSGIYHAFGFRKYAHRYVAEVAYRFNRHFDYLVARVPRLAVALMRATPGTRSAIQIPAKVCTLSALSECLQLLGKLKSEIASSFNAVGGY